MIVLVSSLYGEAADESRTGEALEILREVADARDQLHSYLVSPALERVPGDPVLYLRMVFASQYDYESLLVDTQWRRGLERALAAIGGGRVERIMYEQGRSGVGDPDIRDGIWRALIFSVLPGVSRERREQFERELTMMGPHVSTIRNWSLSRVLSCEGSRSWDYVWEQDFQDVAGLLGEYRMHPIHWGFVDRWFDIENPGHIIDSRFRRRIVCASPRAAIGLHPGG